jgi:hypothetical protein
MIKMTLKGFEKVKKVAQRQWRLKTKPSSFWNFHQFSTPLLHGRTVYIILTGAGFV